MGGWQMVGLCKVWITNGEGLFNNNNKAMLCQIISVLKFGDFGPPPQTPTSGGRVDLWSKIAFLILVWDNTNIKKRGGLIFFQDC